MSTASHVLKSARPAPGARPRCHDRPPCTPGGLVILHPAFFAYPRTDPPNKKIELAVRGQHSRVTVVPHEKVVILPPVYKTPGGVMVCREGDVCAGGTGGCLLIELNKVRTDRNLGLGHLRIHQLLSLAGSATGVAAVVCVEQSAFTPVDPEIVEHPCSACCFGCDGHYILCHGLHRSQIPDHMHGSATPFCLLSLLPRDL